MTKILSKNDMITEMCGSCMTEVELPTKLGVYVCPVCQEFIVNCAMCNMDKVDCSNCRHDKLLSLSKKLWNNAVQLNVKLTFKDKEDTPKLLRAYQKNNNLAYEELDALCEGKVKLVSSIIYGRLYDQYRK